ncbi:hypothetical protein BESB_083540 [Besnoitia besnoiti]|uniref:Signal peptidase complex subunit 2 n=1 Tax=Besnoitia besnoiti TaxID=94643 RepID=A0A2A9M5B3_BESBE|nr:hypothetical protein BESB_083540 [Besnoitia besnoiti]PFH33155.1 hypothetical protein BESB_083540 [Besnoitia besnoiti]
MARDRADEVELSGRAAASLDAEENTLHTAGGDNAEADEEQKQLEKILSNMRRISNLYSEAELLRAVEDYVLDCLTHLGYSEHRVFSNIRLCLASIACCVGAYASFFVPLPIDSIQLKVAIGAFFGALLLLLCVETFFVKNAIACFKTKQGVPFFVDCHVDRATNDLVLAVRQKDACLSTASSVGRFFDEKGYLLIDTLYAELRKLLNDFEQGVTDETKKKPAKRGKRSK